MKRRRGLPPPPPPPQAKKPRATAAKRQVHDMMSVLFETPSGFAIFHCCASLIEGPDVLKVLWDSFTKKHIAQLLVWLKQFQSFEDKSSAIKKNTGVNEMLSEMIKKWHYPGMKLAVGKPEYGQIIEERLNIPCVHDISVMELMWGIQNQMRSLVPEEKSELTEADHLPISQGLHTVLSRYDCVVKPGMVNELIVKTASELFWCDSVVDENSTPLGYVRQLIEKVSEISCENWSLLKIVTAMKAIWCPEEIDDSCEKISEEEVSRLENDRDKYKFFLDKHNCLGAYKDMMSAHYVKRNRKILLQLLVKEAKASEAKQAAERSSG